MATWYERDPRRFAREVLAWRARGFALAAEHLRAAHRVRFEGDATAVGETQRVVVDYPEGFPYARPEVRLPNLPIQATDEHRTLGDGQLCLRGYVPDGWDHSEDGASLLPDVERWIGSHRSGIWENPHEAPDLMVLNRQRIGATVLFDDPSDSAIPEAGEILVDVQTRGNAHLVHVREIGKALRYGQFLDPQRMTRFSGIYTTLSGPPVDLARAMISDGLVSAEDAVKHITAAGGTAVPHKEHRKKKGQKPGGTRQHQLIALRFPMKSGSRQQTVWEVLWWDTGKRMYTAAQVHYRSDTFNRVRHVVDLDRLEKAHVAVLGVGAIGGTVALELARSGVGMLTLIDNDVIAPGNLARHVSELRQVGLPKVCAVAEQIRRRFPNVKVTEGFAGAQLTNLYGSFDALVDLARTVDAVAVCVGNHNLHQFVNDALIVAGKVGVYAWVGPDAVAGRVVRIDPGATGCFWCYEHWVEDKNSDYFHALPEIEDINALPLDYGCNTPAIPGSSFDHGRIALAQTRQLIQALLGPDAKYPYDESHHLLLTNRPLDSIPGSDFEQAIAYRRVQRVPYCPKCGTAGEESGLSEEETAVLTEYLQKE